MLGRLKGSAFARQVLVLMSGTAVAQGLTVLAAPVLSRLYTPDEFGLLGLFMACCAIAANVAALQYQLAIVLPDTEERAANVFALAMAVVVCVSCFLLAMVAVGGEPVAVLLNAPDLRGYLWLAPVYVLAYGAYNVLGYWCTRREEFGRLSASRVFRTAGVTGVQLSAGFSRAGAGGLLAGQVAGQVIAAVLLGVQVARTSGRDLRRAVTLNGMSSQARVFVDFPRYSTPQTLTNSVSQAAPAFLFGALFGPVVVGLYWFTHRILMLPADLVGQSIRQVFLQRASSLFNNQQPVLPHLRRTTRGLAVLAAGPALILMLWGEVLFSGVFGPEWAVAGSYSRWLVLWWVFILINPPSVMLIPILNLQRVHAIYEVALLAGRVLAIVAGAYMGDPLWAIAFFSLVGVVFNGGLVLFVHRKCGQSDAHRAA